MERKNPRRSEHGDKQDPSEADTWPARGGKSTISMTPLVGTPLWEDEAGNMAPTKNAAPIWQQEVVDAEGRRRFHGAFTGGYSAGYYNSVGSAEGWAPSSFKSSRERRAGAPVRQAAEDFMDEEDLQSFGGKQLVANSQFDAIGSTATDVQRQTQVMASGSRSAIPGPAPDELVIPSCEPVGKRLLKLFGWREGQGVGPRQRLKRSNGQIQPVVSCSHGQSPSGRVLPNDAAFLFAPKDTAVFDPGAGKTNSFGLGFDPFSDAPEFRPPSGTATGITSKDAFGIGALEEDDDLVVYERTDRSQCVPSTTQQLLYEH